MIKKLEKELDSLRQKIAGRRADFDRYSESWKVSARGEAHELKTFLLEELADELEEFIRNLTEAL